VEYHPEYPSWIAKTIGKIAEIGPIPDQENHTNTLRGWMAKSDYTLQPKFRFARHKYAQPRRHPRHAQTT